MSGKAERPSDQRIRNELRRVRRWIIWQMEALAEMEGRAAHKLEDLRKLEQRLGNPYDALSPAATNEGDRTCPPIAQETKHEAIDGGGGAASDRGDTDIIQTALTPRPSPERIASMNGHTLDVTEALDGMAYAILRDRVWLAKLDDRSALDRLKSSSAFRNLEYEIGKALGAIDGEIYRRLDAERRLKDAAERLEAARGERDSTYEKCRKLEYAVDEAVGRLKKAVENPAAAPTK